MIRSRVAAALLATLTATASQAGVHPFDTSGSWQGEISCKGLASDGSVLKVAIPFTLALLDQAGEVVGEFLPLGGPGGFPRGVGEPYPVCGTSFADLSKPGKGRINLPTSPSLLFAAKGGVPVLPIALDVAGQVSAPNAKGVSGKAGGPGTIDSFLSGSTASGTCKVKMERVSDVAPTIPELLIEACASVRDMTIFVP